jgi:cyclopropane fatty-acyl-phospholipid synthase-like methyltransferase
VYEQAFGRDLWRLIDGKSVLDVGCGWGGLEREAIRLSICERFDAYDIASGAIETARAEATKEGLQERIAYFCADLNSLVLEGLTYLVVKESILERIL